MHSQYWTRTLVAFSMASLLASACSDGEREPETADASTDHDAAVVDAAMADGSAPHDASASSLCDTDYSGTYVVEENPLNPSVCSNGNFGFGECVAVATSTGYTWSCGTFHVTCELGIDCVCYGMRGSDHYVVIDFPNGAYESSVALGATCQGDF